MANKKNIYERYFPNDEMTKYGFISHLEAYIKQLLNDPSKANVDDFLKKHGIDNEVALKILLKTNGNDPNSAILIKSTSIHPDKDENGEKEKFDKFHIRYKLPRKDYAKKMRNLFSNLYEKNMKEGKLNEGAWGKGPLDNDSALDSQNDFGKICLRILYNRTKIAQDSDAIWSNLGVFIDFVKKYKDDELHFTDEYIDAVNFIKVKLAQLLNDEAWLSTWDDPKEMTSSLKKLYKTIASYQYHKEIMGGERMRGVDDPILSLGESTINEDGEGGTMADMGGATNASSSGQFIQPMAKPIRRKTMYITSEQEEYIKKKLNEDSPNVMNTQAGDFGYDAPASVCSSDDPTLDHKDMMKKSWEEGK